MGSRKDQNVAMRDEVACCVAREGGISIDGGWRAGQSSARLDAFDPLTGERIAQRVDANAADIEDDRRERCGATPRGDRIVSDVD